VLGPVAQNDDHAWTEFKFDCAQCQMSMSKVNL